MTDPTAAEFRTAAALAYKYGMTDAGNQLEDLAVDAETPDLTTQLSKVIYKFEVGSEPLGENIYLRLAGTLVEFLTTTGRLIPEGGRVLTAEQVEDMRTILTRKLLSPGHPEWAPFNAALDRLRDSLFPATEPAEERKPKFDDDVVRQWEAEERLKRNPETLARVKAAMASTDGDVEIPAPAVPAEEETKAEDDYWIAARDSKGGIRLRNGMGLLVAEAACTVNDVKEWWIRADRGGKWERQYQAALDLFDREAASSPVVPAPTETEWPSWEAVPEGRTVQGRRGHTYTKRDGDPYIGMSGIKSCMANAMDKLAPFVAAREGDA